MTRQTALDNKNIALISILYWIVSTILFYLYGVKNVNDSFRYLTYAENLRNGFYVDEHNIWYFGYVLFIYLIHLVHNSEIAIIISQYLLSYVAVIAIYRTGFFMYQDAQKALLCSLSYFLFIEITTWNSYILCESLYLSLTCITLYLLVKIYKQPSNSVGTYILLSLVSIVTIFTKPTGIALAGALLIVLLLFIQKKYTNIVLRFGLTFLLVMGFVITLNKMLDTYNVMESYQIGEIVYGITTLPHKPEYDGLVIQPPSDSNIPPENYPPLLRIILFVAYNPVYWFKLFFIKLFYLIIHIRPYWSLQHNAFTLLTLIPIYFLAARNLSRIKIPARVLAFVIVYLLIHLLSIGITTVDWDGRFLMPLLPVVFLIGAPGITALTKFFDLPNAIHDRAASRVQRSKD